MWYDIIRVPYPLPTEVRNLKISGFRDRPRRGPRGVDPRSVSRGPRPSQGQCWQTAETYCQILPCYQGVQRLNQTTVRPVTCRIRTARLVHLSLKYSVVRSDTPVWLKYSQTVNQRQSLGFSRLVDHPRAGPGSFVIKLPKLNFDLANLPNFWGLCWTIEKNWNWTWTLIWFPISQYVKMHKKFN